MKKNLAKLFLSITKRGKKGGREVHSFLAAARSYSKNVYSRELLTITELGEFEGGVYPIPAGYDRLLSMLYGDYMTLPSPDQRRKKQHAIFVDTKKSYKEYANFRDGMEFEVYTESIR